MGNYSLNHGIFSNLQIATPAQKGVYQSRKNIKPTTTYTSSSGIKNSDIDIKEIFGFTRNTDKTPKAEKERNRKLLNYHMRGYAKDYKLLAKHGVSRNINDPNAPAQFVNGDEDGEVHLRCIFDVHDDQELLDCSENGAISKPGHIVITDNTNGKKNTYKYRRLSNKEIEAGKTKEGQPLNKNQFVPGNTYYVLVSVIDENGNNIKSDNVEVYRLNFQVDDETETLYYNLEQDEGMDGSGESSIDYTKRR